MSKRKLFENIFSLGLVQVANYLVPLFSVPIISRIIGPAHFGILYFATAFVSYFSLFIGYGFDLTATRKISRDPEDAQTRNRVFSETLWAQGLLFLISTLVFLMLMLQAPILKSRALVISFSYLSCLSTLLTQNWLFQAMQDLKKVALLNLAGKLLFTVAVLTAVRRSQDYIWQPLIASLASLAVAACSLTWAINRYRLKLLRIPLWRSFQLLWAEKTVFISLAVISLYTTTNTLILALFRDPVQVGFFGAGEKIIQVVAAIVWLPLNLSLFPFVGKAFGLSFQNGIGVIRKLIPLVAWTTFLIGAGTWILAPYIIYLIYGAAFGPALAALRIMAFLPMIIALSNILGTQVMLNLNLDRPFLVMTLLGAMAGLGLNFLLVPRYGFRGTAWSWMLTECLITLFSYILLRLKGVEALQAGYFSPAYLIAWIRSGITRIKPRQQ